MTLPGGLASPAAAPVYCHFHGAAMTVNDKPDPLEPQREAAFFYGLFLRGHDVDTLRQDIDISYAMLEKWMRARDFQEPFRQTLHRVYAHRKRVLAIFDNLISRERVSPRLQ